jgi:hypothetical protein
MLFGASSKREQQSRGGELCSIPVVLKSEELKRD